MDIKDIRHDNVNLIIRLINDSNFRVANRKYRRPIAEEIQRLMSTPYNRDRVALLKFIISSTTIDKRTRTRDYNLIANRFK